MRSFTVCAFCTLLFINLSAQRYTSVRKFPLFPESTLHTFVFHFPTENDAYNELPERSPWYLPITSGWKYTMQADESNIPQYATWRYVDTLWKPLRAHMATDVKSSNQGTIILRKVVPVPEEWYGLQVFVHFDYVSSPVTLWVNGVRIGNSSTAAWGCEWNVTPYLVFGRLNTILLQWDAAQVAMPEIGNAWLYAFPNVAIWDFAMLFRKNSKNKLVFEAAVLPKTFLPGIEDKYNLELQLYNRRGQQVITAKRKGIVPAAAKWVTLQQIMPAYNIWEADTPYWYTAIFVLKNKDNETVDAVKYRIGIRDINYNDTVLKINDQLWSIDSLLHVNIYTIQPTFLANYAYRWQIFDLTPRAMDDDELLKAIEKQVLSFRNYTPIAAWQITRQVPAEKQQLIVDLIFKLDSSRPILWRSPNNR